MDKISIIELINNELVSHGREQLSVGDFDILYEMELFELMQAREQVQEYLRTLQNM